MSPLPDVDSYATVGGALKNYLIGVVDPTTDRDASGANIAYWDVAAMTATIGRAWARFTLNGTATPVLVAHNSLWGNGVPVQPTGAYSGTTGKFTFTWPTSVSDGIPMGLPGFVGSHTLNFRFGSANARGSVIYHTQVDFSAANIAILYIANSGGSAANPAAATDFDIFVG